MLLPVWDGNGAIPARPIVLGGDDLTLLVRSDLALAFTRTFLEAFEAQTRIQLAPLREKYSNLDTLPCSLTAGAGIAFVRSSHPFHLAQALTESLAGHAKQVEKEYPDNDGRIPPTLAFHRVINASHGDYQDILDRELTFGPIGSRIRTPLSVYGLDLDTGNLPALAHLQHSSVRAGKVSKPVPDFCVSPMPPLRNV